MWANIGLQQFHLPAEDPVQIIRGVISLVYPDKQFKQLRERLLKIDYAFNILPDNGIQVECPFGNTYHIRPSNASTWFGPSDHIDPEYNRNIALPGGDSIGLGMDSVTFYVPPNTAVRIGEFYAHFFDVKPALVDSGKSCIISVGFHQSLVFTEVEAGTDLPAYDGHHVALYINNFVESYHRLKESELVWNNPRFPFTYDTIEDALKHHEMVRDYFVNRQLCW